MKSRILKLFGVAAAITMLIALVPVAALAATSVSNVTVSLTGTTGANAAGVISGLNTYTVTFNTSSSAPVLDPATPDTITLTFPQDTNLGAVVIGDIAVSYDGTGFGGGAAYTNQAPSAAITVTNTTTTRSIVIPVPAAGKIGQTGLVRVVVGNNHVQNPSTAGSYTLQVKTSQDATNVTSPAYAIANPSIPTLPGVAAVYNSTNVQITQGTGGTAILDALTAVGANTGWTITLTPGTYVEAPNFGALGATKLIVKGTAAGVIIQPTAGITVSADAITFDTLTFDATNLGAATLFTATTNGTNLTVKNSTFMSAPSSSTAQTYVAVAAGTLPVGVTSSTYTFDADTFTVTGSGAQVGIATAEGIKVSNSTFTVGASDTAVVDNNTAGLNSTTTLSKDTITVAAASVLALSIPMVRSRWIQ